MKRMKKPLSDLKWNDSETSSLSSVGRRRQISTNSTNSHGSASPNFICLHNPPDLLTSNPSRLKSLTLLNPLFSSQRREMKKGKVTLDFLVPTTHKGWPFNRGENGEKEATKLAGLVAIDWRESGDFHSGNKVARNGRWRERREAPRERRGREQEFWKWVREMERVYNYLNQRPRSNPEMDGQDWFLYFYIFLYYYYMWIWFSISTNLGWTWPKP